MVTVALMAVMVTMIRREIMAMMAMVMFMVMMAMMVMIMVTMATVIVMIHTMPLVLCTGTAPGMKCRNIQCVKKVESQVVESCELKKG